MKLQKLVSLALLAAPFTSMAGVVYSDPNVRFSLISDGSVRMEYAPDGAFTDDKSFLAVERDYPDVKADVSTTGDSVIITTSKMRLAYKKGSGRFTPSNLRITSAPQAAFKFAWKPGDKQKENLLGTYRTLDNYNGRINDETHQPMPIEDGILAKDGWTFIDDSSNLLFDGDKDWDWVKERPSADVQDWYFMAYGKDYKQALHDYTLFAGQMPLPPRYAFGFWWSRYWLYSDNELRNLVDDFKTYDIPLDVLVIDMDWHYTEPGKGGWTGYTWNRSLFPDPEGLLKYIGDNNLQITMNLHPADGIAAYEEQYADVAKGMGLDPASKETIPFEASSKNFVNNWFDHILRPQQDMGVNFWWLDWQQWPNDTKIPSLSNTWWLNYLFFSDMERNGDKRPMLYHRWGGLGNHRYQIGFSGDADITWESLDFQPYFNSTASNVLYGYWSHDIGGHHRGIERIDPEMYVRWMQFGAMSPILRAHSTKQAALKKEPWNFDKEHFEILRGIIRQRYEMSPYIYTMARKAHDTGVSICRPMYYDYPEAQEAYDFANEYMFGDDILVMPITAPMEGNYSKAKVWLPAGNDWYELHTGTLLKGGQTVEREFALDEYPIYVKAGSVIPMTYGLENLRANDNPYTINVYPGGDGSFTLYEDNGNDKNYERNFATTEITSAWHGNTLNVTVAPRKGKYEGMPSERSIDLRLNSMAPPTSVKLNGKEIPFTYDGNTLCVNIETAPMSCSKKREFAITYPSRQAAEITDGTLARFKHMQKGALALKNRNAWIVMKEPLANLESAGRLISYHPEKFATVMEEFNRNYKRLPELLQANDLDSETCKWFLEEINY